MFSLKATVTLYIIKTTFVKDGIKYYRVNIALCKHGIGFGKLGIALD